jgi:hypothetical protein
MLNVMLPVQTVTGEQPKQQCSFLLNVEFNVILLIVAAPMQCPKMQQSSKLDFQIISRFF